MADSRSEGPTRVGEALAGYFAGRGFSRRVKQAAVVGEWAELVGPQIADVTEPISIGPDGTLIVAVSSAAWMQELQLMAPTIVRQLGLRGRKVKRIIWRAQ